MVNAPSEPNKLAFIVKLYANGAFSSQLNKRLQVGDTLEIEGPYGSCFRRENQTVAMILVGGGSGMAPLWSILHDHLEHGDASRPITFFDGAHS